MGKRAFDLLIGGAGFILTAPIALLVALALKLEGDGPVIRPTRRIGQYGRVFTLLRFRTMKETQLTPVGLFVRNYSLDELPQLFNVVKGDISIIGPRPFEVEQVDVHDTNWNSILSAKPGLISYSILQLNRQYNASSLADKQALELEYVDRQSLWFDLQVLCSALTAMLRSRGNVKMRG